MQDVCEDFWEYVLSMIYESCGGEGNFLFGGCKFGGCKFISACLEFWFCPLWFLVTSLFQFVLDPLQIIPIPACPATVGFPLVFHGNGVINSEHAIAYICLPSSSFFQNHDQIRSPWNNCWILFVWFMVFLWMSLCWWFVPLESSAARLAKKIVLNGTSSFTTLGGDLRISKGPRARVVHSHLCNYSLQREFLETFKIEVFDLQVGSNMKQYWVPWNG